MFEFHLLFLFLILLHLQVFLQLCYHLLYQHYCFLFLLFEWMEVQKHLFVAIVYYFLVEKHYFAFEHFAVNLAVVESVYYSAAALVVDYLIHYLAVQVVLELELV